MNRVDYVDLTAFGVGYNEEMIKIDGMTLDKIDELLTINRGSEKLTKKV